MFGYKSKDSILQVKLTFKEIVHVYTVASTSDVNHPSSDHPVDKERED